MASLSTASSTRSTSSASLIRWAMRERSLRLHDMHAWRRAHLHAQPTIVRCQIGCHFLILGRQLVGCASAAASA